MGGSYIDEFMDMKERNMRIKNMVHLRNKQLDFTENQSSKHEITTGKAGGNMGGHLLPQNRLNFTLKKTWKQ